MILIKTPIPNEKVAEEWGDYYFAKSMIKQFNKQGINCRMQFLNQWDEDDSDVDVVITLRGLSMYKVKDYHFNIMWNISHPDKITLEEYYNYDIVYIASAYWTNIIKSRNINTYTSIETLLQCTDIDIFRPYIGNDYNHELLFVGNSRKIYRKIIKDLLPTKYNLSIFGSNWQGLIDNKYIVADRIPNFELYKYYSNAKVVLNDHWDDMRLKGFISNRIFDVLACKGIIITDDVKGLEEYLSNSVLIYKNKKDLINIIEKCMKGQIDKSYVENGYKLVITFHTFENRIEQILKDLNWL